MRESVEVDPVKYSNLNEDMFENGDNDSGKEIVCDSFEQTSESFEQTSESFEQTSETHFTNSSLKQTNEERILKITNIDLNHQVKKMIEKSDSVWKCKVCGKTNPNIGNMWQHAETHIEGMLVISVTKVSPI